MGSMRGSGSSGPRLAWFTPRWWLVLIYRIGLVAITQTSGPRVAAASAVRRAESLIEAADVALGASFPDTNPQWGGIPTNRPGMAYALAGIAGMLIVLLGVVLLLIVLGG
jgi:hypothetical protein